MADRAALVDRTHAEPRCDPPELGQRRAYAGHGVSPIATERGPNRISVNRAVRGSAAVRSF